MEKVNAILNKLSNNVYNRRINDCKFTDTIQCITSDEHTYECIKLGSSDGYHHIYNIDQLAEIKNVKISGVWEYATFEIGDNILEKIYSKITDTFTLSKNGIIETVYHYKRLHVYGSTHKITYDRLIHYYNYPVFTDFQISQCERHKMSDLIKKKYGIERKWYEAKIPLWIPTNMIYMDIPFKCKRVLCSVWIKKHSYVDHIIPFYYSSDMKMWILDTRDNPFYENPFIECVNEDNISIKFIIIPSNTLINNDVDNITIYVNNYNRLRYGVGMAGISFTY